MPELFIGLMFLVVMVCALLVLPDTGDILTGIIKANFPCRIAYKVRSRPDSRTINDLDVGTSTSLYGSKPIGMEVQVTLWGYARSDALGDVLLR